MRIAHSCTPNEHRAAGVATMVAATIACSSASRSGQDEVV